MITEIVMSWNLTQNICKTFIQDKHFPGQKWCYFNVIQINKIMLFMFYSFCFVLLFYYYYLFFNMLYCLKNFSRVSQKVLKVIYFVQHLKQARLYLINRLYFISERNYYNFFVNYTYINIIIFTIITTFEISVPLTSEMIAIILCPVTSEYKTLAICHVIFIWASNILWLHVNLIR